MPPAAMAEAAALDPAATESAASTVRRRIRTKLVAAAVARRTKMLVADARASLTGVGVGASEPEPIVAVSTVAIDGGVGPPLLAPDDMDTIVATSYGQEALPAVSALGQGVVASPLATSRP